MDKPEITSLEPSEAKINWKGVVKIHGKGFDRLSIVFFDTSTLPIGPSSTPEILFVKIDTAITGVAGPKPVRVHTGGYISNERNFTVRKKRKKS